MTAQNPPPKESDPVLFRSALDARPVPRGGHQFFILILVILVTLRSAAFLSFDNFKDILLNISILAIVALAQTMVIITHGIDLSVSSMIGLVAMMVAFVVKHNPDMPVVLTILLGHGAGRCPGHASTA